MQTDLEKWIEIVRTSKTSWILRHLSGRGDSRSLGWTLEDNKLNVDRNAAWDVLYDEIDARIQPRGLS